MSTRFVFFDLGNVLALFCHERLLQQLADVAQLSRETVKIGLFVADGLQARFEKGELSVDEYFETVCKRIGRQIERTAFFCAVNEIFQLNDEMMPFVSALAAADFPRGILSNTGPAHWHHCITAFPEIPGKIPNNHVLSFQVHELKPSHGIYDSAFRTAERAVPGISPNEILFIDDLPKNVQGAVDYGIDAVLYTNPVRLRQDFAQRGLPTELHGGSYSSEHEA
ncbi:MAG: HAD family phosphatase [Planctomycetaceae bacterium]|nr:HAD family phosphatase [Planctomycetaceae bacterium]